MSRDEKSSGGKSRDREGGYMNTFLIYALQKVIGSRISLVQVENLRATLK